MPISQLDPFIVANYEVHEWRHATAVLGADFPDEFADIQAVLRKFRLFRSNVLAPGGRKSDIAGWIDGEFSARGWREKRFETHSGLTITPWIRRPTRSIA